jgi:hypothetical protein
VPRSQDLLAPHYAGSLGRLVQPLLQPLLQQLLNQQLGLQRCMPQQLHAVLCRQRAPCCLLLLLLLGGRWRRAALLLPLREVASCART